MNGRRTMKWAVLKWAVLKWAVLKWAVPMWGLVVVLGVAACEPGSGETGEASGDLCVDQPTTALLLTSGSREALPGQTISIGYQVDTRGADGVLTPGEGVLTIDGPGEVMPTDGPLVHWRAGMEPGQYRLKLSRAGCPEDFILANAFILAPEVERLSGKQSFGGSTALAWSPDSASLAVAGLDRLLIADTDGQYTGLGSTTGVASVVQHVAWSADGRWIAVGGDDGPGHGAILFEADGLKPITRFPVDAGAAVAFSPGGEFLYSATVVSHPNQTDYFALDVMDLQSAWSTRVMSGSGGYVEPPVDLQVDAEVAYLAGNAVAHGSGARLQTYRCEDQFKTIAVRPHPATNRVFVLGENRVCAISRASGQQRALVAPNVGTPRGLAIDPLGEAMVIVGTGCGDAACDIQRGVRLVRGDLQTLESWETVWQLDREASAVAFSPDGQFLAIAHPEGLTMIPREALWTWGIPAE